MNLGKIISTVAALLFLSIAVSAFGQEGTPRQMFNSSEPSVKWSFRDGGVATCSALSDGVWDVDVTKSGSSQYNVSLTFPMPESMRKGSVGLASLRMRTLFARQETGESAVYFYLQRGQDPYEKLFNTQICVGSEWKEFQIPFQCGTEIPDGQSVVELAFGSLAQHVEISDVKILDYGPDVDIATLPKTAMTYAGREENAPWRAEALKRIEEIRTAPVTVVVKDAKGRPVKGAQVTVKMDEAQFVWGTAVNEGMLAGDGEGNRTYKKNLSEFFNTAIIENGFKAGGWAWEAPRKQNTLDAFTWLCENNFRMRGHNLVWPGWKFNPSYTRKVAKMGPEIFDQYIKGQFYERIAITKGKLIAWDVVNEPMHETDFFPLLPKEALADWFKLAHELDPDAQLFINDYAMLNGAQSPTNIGIYIDMIRDLLAQGAPVQAIGVQGHVGNQPRSPMQVITDLDLFKPLGLPVQITEFDVNTDDEQLQADYMRDFLIAVYSHPVIEGVNLWGFWQGAHWKPDAAMFRRDWTEKPSAAVWRSLVLGDWHTDKTVKTGKDGKAEVRGHFGTYTVTVTFKGVSKTGTLVLDKDGETLSFTM